MAEPGDARELPVPMVEAIHDLEDPLLTRAQCEAVLFAAGVPALLARVEAAEADRNRYGDALAVIRANALSGAYTHGVGSLVEFVRLVLAGGEREGE